MWPLVRLSPGIVKSLMYVAIVRLAYTGWSWDQFLGVEADVVVVLIILFV